MFNYLLRRSLIGLITLVLITFVIFGLIRNMPGTPLTLALAEVDPSRQISEEDMKRMEKVYGLDKPIPEAYMQWLGNLARLDLGRSISRKQPVTRLIGERIGPTMLLSVTSLGLAYLLSVPLGLYSTARSGRPGRAGHEHVSLHALRPAFVRSRIVFIGAFRSQAQQTQPSNCRCSAWSATIIIRCLPGEKCAMWVGT